MKSGQEIMQIFLSCLEASQERWTDIYEMSTKDDKLKEFYDSQSSGRKYKYCPC